MKQIITLVASGALFLCLTACGETPPTQQAEAVQTQAVDTQAAPEAAPEAAPDTTSSADAAPQDVSPAEAAGATTEE